MAAFIYYLAVLVQGTLAIAATKISLVTVAPGPVIFESFGHSLILVESSQTPGSAVLYEYGGINTREVIGGRNPLEGLTKLFSSKLKAKALKRISPMSATSQIPLYLQARYLSNSKAPRKLAIHELALAPEQSAKFVELLEKDMVAGEYEYDNYANNCVTKLRDRLFDDQVLGKSIRLGFDQKVDVTLQKISMESLDEAAKLSPTGTVRLVPALLERFTRVQQTLAVVAAIGFPTEFKSAAEFLDAAKQADEKLSQPNNMMALMMSETTSAFHEFFFAKRLTESPVAEYSTLFTPQRFLQALTKVVNPATKKPLIVERK